MYPLGVCLQDIMDIGNGFTLNTDQAINAIPKELLHLFPPSSIFEATQTLGLQHGINSARQWLAVNHTWSNGRYGMKSETFVILYWCKHCLDLQRTGLLEVLIDMQVL